MGYPGSGKSYFARQFSELYKVARISEDRIRFELFEKPLFNEDELDIITRILQYTIEQIMHTEQTIICEGSFLKNSERKAMVDLARANGYRTLTVWLQTDLETSEQRAANRDRRNPDSKYSFEIDKQLFSRIRSDLERPSEKEEAVVISGKHAFKNQCLTVLRKIAAMYSDSASKGEFTVKPEAPVRPAGIRVRTNNQRFVQ